MHRTQNNGYVVPGPLSDPHGMIGWREAVRCPNCGNIEGVSCPVKGAKYV
jgi:hypothetical protein